MKIGGVAYFVPDVMDEVMTNEEIQSRFDSEWVLVGDPVTDATNHVLSGRVLAHSKDRDEVYRAGITAKPRSFAILYTGSIPAGTEVAL